MTPSMPIPCRAVLLQRTGRIPYAYEPFVAMRTQGGKWIELFLFALRHKATLKLQIFRFLLRCLTRWNSKRGSTFLSPFLFAQLGADAQPRKAAAKAVPCCAAVGASMRREPYHPLAGLAVVLVVGFVFWSGIVLLAEKFL